MEWQRNELAHLSRVGMLGELSSSLAHELNQPLMAILSNAQAAQRFLAHDSTHCMKCAISLRTSSRTTGAPPRSSGACAYCSKRANRNILQEKLVKLQEKLD